MYRADSSSSVALAWSRWAEAKKRCSPSSSAKIATASTAKAIMLVAVK